MFILLVLWAQIACIELIFMLMAGQNDCICREFRLAFPAGVSIGHHFDSFRWLQKRPRGPSGLVGSRNDGILPLLRFLYPNRTHQVQCGDSAVIYTLLI